MRPVLLLTLLLTASNALGQGTPLSESARKIKLKATTFDVPSAPRDTSIETTIPALAGDAWGWGAPLDARLKYVRSTVDFDTYRADVSDLGRFGGFRAYVELGYRAKQLSEYSAVVPERCDEFRAALTASWGAPKGSVGDVLLWSAGPVTAVLQPKVCLLQVMRAK